MARRDLLLLAAVRRQSRAQRRAFAPVLFRHLGDPRHWPGFARLSDPRRRALTAAYAAWRADAERPHA